MPNPQQLITTTTKDGGSVDNAGAIIDHLNIWTAAIKKRGSQGRGSSKKIELHGIKKLRELILELAVRGLLVPQNPNDEPASVLLEKIAAEKAQLIKDGKIKKQKPLPKISEDEKPFELPKGWEWARLGQLSSDIHYGYTASAQPENLGVRLLRITDIQNDKVNWSTVPGCEITTEKSKAYLLEDDDILIARTGGTIGKSYLVENINVEAVFASYLIRVKRISSMYSPFIKTYLGSAIYWKQLYDNASGTGQPNVNATALKSLLFPIPPEAEQPRIVAKVDELMALCDQLEQQTEDSLTAHQTLVDTLLKSLLDAAQTTPGHASSAKPIQQDQNENQKDKTKGDPFQQAWQMIWENFDALFTTEHSIDQLKQTILQLAVMGKLVPQNENDEPASVLLEKIAAEKAQLIKDGKVKKQKALPEISEDEKPFELPKGWEWSTLSDLNALVTDGDHQAPPKANEGVPFLVIGNLNKGVVDFTNTKYVPISYYEKLDWARKPCSDDLLYTVTGSYGIPVKIESNKPFCVQRHVAILKATKSTPTEYLTYALSSKMAYVFATEVATGIAQKTVPLTGLRKMPIALPPKAEYKIIVSKIDELMTLCDTLKERIRESQTTQIHLADAMAEQALKE